MVVAEVTSERAVAIVTTYKVVGWVVDLASTAGRAGSNVGRYFIAGFTPSDHQILDTMSSEITKIVLSHW